MYGELSYKCGSSLSQGKFNVERLVFGQVV